MKNSIQILVREAFNTAYNLHKENKKIVLNEDSASQIYSKLNDKEKAEADNALDILLNQKRGWENYKWTPGGTTEGLNEKQFNYVIEYLIENAKSTQDPKIAKIFASLYSPQSTRKVYVNPNTKKRNIENVDSALYMSILNSNSQLRDAAAKNPEMIHKALSDSWGRMFFTDYWNTFINNYNSVLGANIGSFIKDRLASWTKDKSIKLKQNKISLDTKSMDAPSQVTGKPDDLGDTTDDATGSIEPETEYSEYENIPSDFDTNVSKKQKADIQIIQKIQKAFQEIVRIAKTHSNLKDSKGLIAFEDVVLNFLNYKEIAKKYPELYSPTKSVIANLKNKKLVSIANEVLSKYNLSYDIFSDSNWKEKYNLGTGVVDEIINSFKNTFPAGKQATYINSIVGPFKEYAINHKTPEEIADDLGLSAENAVGVDFNSLLSSDEKSTKAHEFIKIADSVLNNYGLNTSIEDIDFSNWVKAGKEYNAVLDKPVEVSSSEEDSDTKNKDLYPFGEGYDKFLSENLEVIMERVYKRLERLL